MSKYLIYIMVIFLLFSCAENNKKGALFPEYNISEIDNKATMADSISKATAKKLDIVNNTLLTTQKEIENLKNSNDYTSIAKIEELEVTLSLLTEAFKDLYETVSAIKVLPQIKITPKKPKRPKGFVVSDASGLFDGDEYNIYNRALENYRKEFFLQARQLFTAQLEKFPKGKLADRAQYWIGETYFAEKSFDKAIIEFQKVENYKGSTKQDDALFKIGLCYYKLNENDTAKEMFNKLIARYPASEYVKIAKEYSKKLSL